MVAIFNSWFGPLEHEFYFPIQWLIDFLIHSFQVPFSINHPAMGISPFMETSKWG